MPVVNDLAAFRAKLREVLTRAQRDSMEIEDVAWIFDSAVALCGELERYRAGAQKRTLVKAAQVAALSRELRAMPTSERIAAICARTELGRSQVYNLLKIASQSGPA